MSAKPRMLPEERANQTVLVIDDEPDIRQLVSLALSRIGIDTHTAANLAEARELLATYNFGACLTDMRLPDGSGVDFVAEIVDKYPNLPVAVISAHGQIAAAVDAMRKGAFDFVSKPVDVAALRRLTTQALQLRAPMNEPLAGQHAGKPEPANEEQPVLTIDGAPSGSVTSEQTGPRLIDGESLLGSSDLMQALRDRVAKVARTNAPVWITGESGTGKELVARLIHANGPRSGGPFIAINCGAIPSELMESELFGHRKGAFTGAYQDKEGLFCAAESGTLFLDEIAELPLHMQVKLLRAIQERSVRPVGAANERPIDVRLLSASHTDLNVLVEAGKFRQDLYYRLNVISIRSPALRERPEDIPVLAKAIIKKLGSGEPAEQPTLSAEALSLLKSHDFPGNVRELENILERVCAMTSNRVIDAHELEMEQLAKRSGIAPVDGLSTSPLQATERESILAALQQTRWNRKQCAAMLGLTYRQLRYRIQRLDLENPDTGVDRADRSGT